MAQNIHANQDRLFYKIEKNILTPKQLDLDSETKERYLTEWEGSEHLTTH